MKKRVSLLLILLSLLLLFPLLPVSGSGFGGGMWVPKFPGGFFFPEDLKTPKPTRTPKFDWWPPKTPKFTKIPDFTPKPSRTPKRTPKFSLSPPQIKTPGFTIPTPTAIPLVPLPKPSRKPKTGRFVTSEGPPFLMFRSELTRGYEMFTPMDLSVDGEYVIRLISNALHVVGEVTVKVENGMVTVRPKMLPGVTLKKGTLTFFSDIGSVKTIRPAKLKRVNLPFNRPIKVTQRFNTDAKMLLYINCPVRYKNSNPAIDAFSFEDADYIERLRDLFPLMD